MGVLCTLSGLSMFYFAYVSWTPINEILEKLDIGKTDQTLMIFGLSLSAIGAFVHGISFIFGGLSLLQPNKKEDYQQKMIRMISQAWTFMAGGIIIAGVGTALKQDEVEQALQELYSLTGPVQAFVFIGALALLHSKPKEENQSNAENVSPE